MCCFSWFDSGKKYFLNKNTIKSFFTYPNFQYSPWFSSRKKTWVFSIDLQAAQFVWAECSSVVMDRSVWHPNFKCATETFHINIDNHSDSHRVKCKTHRARTHKHKQTIVSVCVFVCSIGCMCPTWMFQTVMLYVMRKGDASLRRRLFGFVLLDLVGRCFYARWTRYERCCFSLVTSNRRWRWCIFACQICTTFFFFCFFFKSQRFHVHESWFVYALLYSFVSQIKCIWERERARAGTEFFPAWTTRTAAKYEINVIELLTEIYEKPKYTIFVPFFFFFSSHRNFSNSWTISHVSWFDDIFWRHIVNKVKIDGEEEN